MIAPLLPALAGAAYALGVLRLTRRGHRWPGSGSLAAAAGFIALIAACAPPLAGAMTFRLHVVAHLLLAMVAPAALALGAPVTLALRTLPPAGRRALVTTLHLPCVRVLTAAPLVLVLDVGGMYAYYLTPLFGASDHRPLLHVVVHAHMFLAGCLLSWLLVGRDPLPRRPSTRSKLVVLLLAAASHDLLAKLMYAYGLPHGAGPASEVRAGAQLMYYGGDLIEVMLAVALLTRWYARSGRRLTRSSRPDKGSWAMRHGVATGTTIDR